MIKLACTLLSTVMVWAAAPVAWADYPEKNIDFIIPFGPGGGFDRTVRLFSPALEKAMGGKIQVLPKNIAGAGGRKGLATVYRAKPDGYLFTIANMPGAALPELLGTKVEYELPKFTWIARLATEEYMLAVSTKSSFKTIEDLRKLGRPVKITNTDFGSTASAAAAMLASAIKFPVIHLTGYKGTADYIVAIIRGDGDAALAPVSTLSKYLAAGDMRGIFSTEAKSSVAGVPDIGSLGFSEFSGLGVERFVLAPPGLPANVLRILSEAFARAAKDPQLLAAVEKSGESVSFLNAEQAKAAAEQSLVLYKKYASALPHK